MRRAVIHAIAGGFALGILVHLGPRIGKFKSDGTPRNIVPQNPWLVTIGLFMIYTGFWGFYVACNIPIFGIGTWIIWHLIQFRAENALCDEEEAAYSDPEKLKKAMSLSNAETLTEALKVHAVEYK